MNDQEKEAFELHVHKCFGKIFENLGRIDATVKQGSEEEEARGEFGVMTELREWVEDAILHCHLAWQYHRLSRSGRAPNTWTRMYEEERNSEESSDGQ